MTNIYAPFSLLIPRPVTIPKALEYNSIFALENRLSTLPAAAERATTLEGVGVAG